MSMTMKTLAAVALLASTSALENNGAWSEVEVNEAQTTLLTKALADDELYSESLKSRMCFVEINALGSQVVSGTKYKFQVSACEVTDGKAGGGKCAGEYASCKATPYEIIVFDQPWTETIQVLSIEADATDATDASSVSGEGSGSAGNSTEASTGGSEASSEASRSEAPTASSLSDSSDGMIVVPPSTPSTATDTPSPSSAVPSPSPTSGAATSKSNVAVLVASGVVMIGAML